MRNGIHLSGTHNSEITGNDFGSNQQDGVYLDNADNNNLSCNWVHDNNRSGYYLTGGSTGNTIEENNIVSNGNYNTTSKGYEWNFYNAQSQAVAAEDNYWGAGMTNDTIEASIKEASGSVGYYPHREGQAPCAPVPELSTIVLFTVGLLLLLGYVRMARGR